MATKYEANSEMATASARAENRNLLTPYKKVTGKKTTTVVNVAASTARLTSAPALFGGDFRGGTHFQVPVDVLERDDGVVYYARERQRQSAQNHRIHGAAKKVERHKGRQGGKRNGQEYGHRGAQAAQEDQDHEAGQNKPDQPFVQKRVDGLFDEGRLIEDHGR